MKIASSEHFVYINCSECQDKNQSVYTTCSQDVLSLELICTELVIQRAIFLHIVSTNKRTNPFTVQPRHTAHSPKLIFHIMKSWDQRSVPLSVTMIIAQKVSTVTKNSPKKVVQSLFVW